jgi:hypothetical protein
MISIILATGSLLGKLTSSKITAGVRSQESGVRIRRKKKEISSSAPCSLLPLL